jgi:hypothetical protein
MQTGRESDVLARVISNCRAYRMKLLQTLVLCSIAGNGEQAKLLLVSH